MDYVEDTDQAQVMVVNTAEGADRRPLVAPSAAAPPVVKTYKRRWYILAVYSALGFMQCAIWNTWGPITEAALVAFPGWGELTISSLTNVALIAFIVCMAPYCWLLDKKGVRPAVVLMAACLAVGTSLRCITLHQPFFNIFAFVASVLTGVAGIMAMAAPPYISAMWFAPHQRTTATGIPNVLNQLGMSGSFLLGPLVVTQPSKIDPPSGNGTGNGTGPEIASLLAEKVSEAASAVFAGSAHWINHHVIQPANITNGTHPTAAELRADIMNLMYIDAGICVVLFVMVLAYFPSKPPLPPSISASTNTVGFREGLGMALRHPDLICIVLSYSLSQGVMGAWFGVMDINVRPLGVTENEASMMGMWSGICCCGFALLVARLTDMFRGHIKATIISLLVVGCAHWCWLLAIVAGWAPFSNVHLFCAVLVAVSCTYSASPLLFEYASEVSYPIPEDVVGATMSFSFNLVGMLYLLFFLNKWLDEEAIQSIADIAELIEEGAGSPSDLSGRAGIPPDLAAQLREDSDTEPLDLAEQDDGDEREVMEFEDGVNATNFSQSPREADKDIDSDLSCTTHIMFLADSQLGNFMVKYAVLYGFQRKFGAKAYLFPKQHRFASKIFRKLSIDVVPDKLKTADWRPVSYEDIMYMLPCNKYVSEEEFFIITDWPADNGLQVYSQYVDEIRRDFQFTPTVRTRARRYTERFRASPNTTLVGIHIRRGDHILHTWLRHQRKVPDLDYVNKSMQYYANMFSDVRFVACSDDRRYLLNKLVPNAPYPVHTIDSLNQVHDMALLAACDHTIISVGTFGLFSGLLTGGSIVAASRQTGTRGDPFDIQVNPPGDIAHAFLWN